MVQNSTTLDFEFRGSKKIRAAFDAAPISSDGGLLLVERVDRQLGLLHGLARSLGELRRPAAVVHSLVDVIRQRTYQIAAGYEDCNDARALRGDPVLKTCCGRDPVAGPDLASQPTLSRLENAADSKRCYRMGRELLDSYFRRHSKRPRELILDVDTTDDPTHGQQELSFFHAFYDNHIYLPLVVFDQDGDLLAAVLQPGKPRSGRTAVAILSRIIVRARRAWPGVRILVRGDSAFASPDLYRMCERLGVDFLLGIGTNKRLKPSGERLQEKARRKFLHTTTKVRIFTSFRYRALRRWPRSYRVIVKAEHSSLGPNVRFVVTNLRGRADELYERYVQRGESCENSIKDLKNALKADRLSCHRFWANQFRLLLHAAAYVLLNAVRRLAHGTELATAQMDTIRLRLLKIGTQVTVTTRRIRFHFSSSHCWSELWTLIACRLLLPEPFA